MKTEPTSVPGQSEQKYRCVDSGMQDLASLLTGRYRLNRITCFGVNEARDFSASVEPVRTPRHYFILVETKELYPESVIQDYVNNHFSGGRAFVLAHHQGKILEMLQAGHRFYFGVRRSGILLFADEPDQVLQPFPLSGNWIEQAGEHFKTHFGMAGSFLDGAARQLESGQMRIALFLLHQTVEQACIGMIRVFLGYRANFHNLNRLLELCSCFIRPPFSLFPATTGEEQRQFRMLCRSYTEARYREDFTIYAEDCREIQNAVRAFVEKAGNICRDRLALLSENPAFSKSG